MSKVVIDKENNNYNFLVHKNGVTILDQDKPIGIISIKDWLAQNRSSQQYSVFPTNEDDTRVLHCDEINHLYFIEYPARKQTIVVETEKHKTVNKTYHLPTHYWLYNHEYCLLFGDSNKRYPFVKTLIARIFYNIHADYHGQVCWGNVKQCIPTNLSDVTLAYNTFWKSKFNESMDYDDNSIMDDYDSSDFQSFIKGFLNGYWLF